MFYWPKLVLKELLSWKTRKKSRENASQECWITAIINGIIRISHYRMMDLQFFLCCGEKPQTNQPCHRTPILFFWCEFNPFTLHDTSVPELETSKFLICQSLKLPHWQLLWLPNYARLHSRNEIWGPRPVIARRVLSWCPRIQSSILDLSLQAATRGRLGSVVSGFREYLFILANQAELIRIIGMYRMNTILWWIFLLNPLLETCLVYL